MNWIIRQIIMYCANRALKYDQIKDMLVNQKYTKEYIFYSIGTAVMNRDLWLKRIVWLESLIKK